MPNFYIFDCKSLECLIGAGVMAPLSYVELPSSVSMVLMTQGPAVLWPPLSSIPLYCPTLNDQNSVTWGIWEVHQLYKKQSWICGVAMLVLSFKSFKTSHVTAWHQNYLQASKHNDFISLVSPCFDSFASFWLDLTSFKLICHIHIFFCLTKTRPLYQARESSLVPLCLHPVQFMHKT